MPSVDKTFAEARSGDTVADVWRQLHLTSSAPTYVNGYPATADTVLAGGDHVTLRVLPRNMDYTSGGSPYYDPTAPGNGMVTGSGSSQPPGATGGGQASGGLFGGMLGKILGGGVGAGALALLSFMGKSSAAGNSNSVNSSLAQPPGQANSNNAPVDGIGGAKDTLIPLISGVTNQEDQWGVIRRVYGTYKVYPVVVGQPYSTLAGNNQTEHCIYEFGYGELAVTDIRVDNQPIANYAPDLTYGVFLGKSTDGNPTLYTGENADTAVGIQMPNNAGLTTGQAARYATSIAVTIAYPNGLFQTVKTVTNGVTTESFQQYTVSVEVICRPRVGSVGGTLTTMFFTIVENIQTSFRQTLVVPVPLGLYDVSVTQSETLAAPGGVITDNVTYELITASQAGPSFRRLVAANGQNIYTSKIEIAATSGSKVSGSIGEVSAVCTSVLRHWNGTIWNIPQPTSNPADIALDILQGTAAYGYVTDDRLDLPSFLAWFNFCQIALISFNRLYDSATTAIQALNEVLAIGRAKLVLHNNKYSIVIDQLQTQVIQHFTDRNTKDPTFLISWNQQPACVRVQFIDPTTIGAWQQNERLVFDFGFSVNNFPTNQVVQLAGCTDPATAYRYGNFIINTNKLRPITYQFTAYLEALVCTMGDLVKVRCELFGAGLGQGRITAVTTNGSGDVVGITIDAPQLMLAGSTYSVRIRQADGSTFQSLVTNIPGTTKSFTLTTPALHTASILPQFDDLVLFGLFPESKDCLVTNVEYQDSNSAKITCVDYSPAIYDIGVAPPFNNPIQSQHPAQIIIADPVILSVESDEGVLVRDTDGAFVNRAVFQMGPVASNVGTFEYQIRRTGGTTWGDVGSAPVGGSLSIYGVDDATNYDFQIRSRAFTGDISNWVPYLNYEVIGKSTPPPDLLPLYQDPKTGALQLQSPFYPPDYAGAQVRINLGDNSTWEIGTIIGQLVTGNTFDITPWQAGVVTFMAKGVDVAGNQSVNAAVLRKGFGDIIPANTMFTIPLSPTFPGTITGATVVSGQLVSNGGGIFWSGNKANKFWSMIPTDRFYNTQYTAVEYDFSVTVPSAVIRRPFRLYLDLAIQAQSYQILYRAPNPNLFWSNVPGSKAGKFWGAPTDLFWPQRSPNYVPWPAVGITDAGFGRYDFKIIAQSSQIKTIISALSGVIDAPTIELNLYNLQDTTGTGVIPLTIPNGYFRQILYGQYAIISDPAFPNVAFVVINKTGGAGLTGPTAFLFDKDGNPTGGSIDVTLGGY